MAPAGVLLKHARATEARIALGSDGDTLRMSVTDNGAGFVPSAVPSGHLGLEGMRARAERIGALLTVTSRPGAGTRIDVSARMETDAADDLDVAVELGPDARLTSTSAQ